MELKAEKIGKEKPPSLTVYISQIQSKERIEGYKLKFSGENAALARTVLKNIGIKIEFRGNTPDELQNGWRELKWIQETVSKREFIEILERLQKLFQK